MDCIRIFKYLISSSITPVGWSARSGYLQKKKFPVVKIKSPQATKFRKIFTPKYNNFQSKI